MAKDSAANIAERIEVRHHSTHENSPSQAEILLSGKRIGYVSYGEGHHVSFLPHKYGVKLTAAEARDVVAASQAKASELAKAAADERAELRALGIV